MLTDEIKNELIERLSTGDDAASREEAEAAVELLVKTLTTVRAATEAQDDHVVFPTADAAAMALWMASSVGLMFSQPPAPTGE